MSEKGHHGHKWMPVMYATYYGIFSDIAKKYGYALAVHGSFTRDMDLVAIPWTADAKDPVDMIREMSKAAGWKSDEVIFGVPVAKKPHGRVAYHITTGGGGYADISVMPRKVRK